jgi:hypothetical protein
MVELTLGGHQHSFQEPSAIVNSGKRLLFVCGDVGEEEMSDEELFQEAESGAHRGDTVYDILQRTSRNPTYMMEINLGPKVKKSKGKTKSVGC